MKRAVRRTPQQTGLYRLVAFLTRFQLGTLLRSARNPRTLLLLFVFSAGTIAIGIITAAAFVTRLPLLFPPLGPSAFILFYAPMSESASPRNVILAHGLALAAGLASFWLMGMAFADPAHYDPAVLSWSRVASVALAMGATSLVMATCRCAHPPAAATALIAAMGYLRAPTQALGLMSAVVLLVAEAFVFNRLVGGLPYPTWRADPRTYRGFGELAGISEAGANFWQQLQLRMFRQDRPARPSAKASRSRRRAS